MEQRDFQQVMERYGDDSASRSIFDEGYVSFLEDKWAPAMGDITGDYHRRVCAVAFENQMKELQRRTRGSLAESSGTQNVGSYTKYIFPILRKLFPNLIAHNLVTVQPMSAPIGAVFFWDYLHGTTKGSVTAGQSLPDNGSAYYSSEYIDGEQFGVGDGAKWGGVGAPMNAQCSFYPVRPLNTTYGYSAVIQELNAVTGLPVQTATDDGSGNFTGASLAGSINYATGAITGFLFTAAVGNGNPVKAYYRYNMEMNSLVPEVNFDISMEAVKAEPRKLRFKWSPESTEDLAAFHGVSGESQLVSGVAQQMMYEIDREIILDVLAYSAGGTTATFDISVPVGTVNTIDALRRIFFPMNDVNAAIHRKTQRSPTNWIVTSPQVVGLLQNFATHGDYRGNFTGNASPVGPLSFQQVPSSWSTMSSQMGVVQVGVLNNK